MTQEQAERATYDVARLQDKWRAVWESSTRSRRVATTGARAALRADMFPYPRGDLHMGHAEVMALHDVSRATGCSRGTTS